MSDAFLSDIWYVALPSAALKPGGMAPVLMLGERFVLVRDKAGNVSALRDVCPHRGIPLSRGSFDGCEVECCYHGWRFGMDGRCTSIPSLTGEEGVQPEKIKVRRFAAADVEGHIWVFWGDAEAANVDDIPRVGDARAASGPGLTESMVFSCHIDHAVVGLMDPAHGPFVHQSWWWRSRRSIHAKQKAFGPAPYGFRMKRHAPSSNSFAYKVLGGKPETEIRFSLPGVRIEHIAVGRNFVANLTAVTPIDEKTTRITHSIFWSAPWLSLLKPLVRPFTRAFLNQDRQVVDWQQEGLAYEKNLMLIRDADTQAIWYYRLKKEWDAAQAEKRAFANPVPDTILTWRS